jgi:hypothetical protein
MLYKEGKLVKSVKEEKLVDTLLKEIEKVAVKQ